MAHAHTLLAAKAAAGGCVRLCLAAAFIDPTFDTRRPTNGPCRGALAPQMRAPPLPHGAATAPLPPTPVHRLHSQDADTHCAGRARAPSARPRARAPPPSHYPLTQSYAWPAAVCGDGGSRGARARSAWPWRRARGGRWRHGDCLERRCGGSVRHQWRCVVTAGCRRPAGAASQGGAHVRGDAAPQRRSRARAPRVPLRRACLHAHAALMRFKLTLFSFTNAPRSRPKPISARRQAYSPPSGFARPCALPSRLRRLSARRGFWKQ